MEVDEETQANTGEAEVGEEPGCMNGVKFLHRLQFNDDLSGNEDVKTISKLESHSFILDRYPDLRFDFHSTYSEFSHKTSAICRFKQPGSEE